MTAPPEKKLLRQPAWFTAILMTVAAVWLHFYFWVHAGGFWRDEVNLINLAGSPSFAAMTHDSFPVLMPLLVRGWTIIGFGQSDLSLRFLGILIGLGILAALWLSALSARRPPLFSLALFCLNTTVIFYGDSLRGYGLGSMGITLAVGAMWFFLNKPSWLRAGILAAAATLSVQSLYPNAVLFSAICLGAWVICWRRKNFRAAVKILLAGLFAAASLLPYWATISSLPEASASLRMGFYPAIAFANFDSVVSFPLGQYIYVWELLGLIVIGFGLAALCATKFTAPTLEKTSDNDAPLFAAATLLAALVFFIGFLWYAALPTQPWYYLPVACLFAACFDLGVPLASLPRQIRAAFFGLIAATALIGVPFAQRDLDWNFTDVDRLARQLQAEAGPQDFVVVTPWFCGITFERYFKSPPAWQTLPPLADHSTHRYDLLREKMQTPGALQPVLDQITATLQSGHNVWVVGNLPPTVPAAPPVDLPPPPLKNSGWADLPYAVRWSAQAAWFLDNHSLRFERVDHETNANVNYYEDLQLFRAAGWKNSNSETNRP